MQETHATRVYMSGVRQILVGLIWEDSLEEEPLLEQLECGPQLIPNSCLLLVGSLHAFSEKGRQAGGEICFW